MLNRLLKSKLLGNTAIYALANVLNGAIPFMLLPILTRVFTPEEYGLVTLVSAVIAIMGAFTGLSAHGAVSVKYFDKTVHHPQFVGASLLVLGGSTTFVLVFLMFAGDAISSWINLPKKWLFIAAIASAAQFVINIRLALWQVQEQPIRYGLFQVSQTFFNLCLSIALIFWAIWGWQGRTWGIALASVVFCIAAIASMQKKKLVIWKRNHDYERDVIAFGFPLIPHVLGGFAIAMSDRFILTSLLGVNAVGHYAVGVQMAMVVGLLGDALAKAFGPYLFKNLSDANTRQQFQNLVFLSYLNFLFLLITTGVYCLLLPFIYPLLIGEQFQDSLEVARIAAFGYAFQGMYYTVAGFLFYTEKTKQLSLITFSSGLLGAIISYCFVTQIGIQGAAWAMVVTHFIFFMLTWMMANKAYPLPWFDYVRMDVKNCEKK